MIESLALTFSERFRDGAEAHTTLLNIKILMIINLQADILRLFFFFFGGLFEKAVLLASTVLMNKILGLVKCTELSFHTLALKIGFQVLKVSQFK